MRSPERSIFVMPKAGVYILEDASLPADFGRAAFAFIAGHQNGRQHLGLREFLDLFERAVIFEALARSEGSQKEAARSLGLKKTTLNMKLRKHNVKFGRRPL